MKKLEPPAHVAEMIDRLGSPPTGVLKEVRTVRIRPLSLGEASGPSAIPGARKRGP